MARSRSGVRSVRGIRMKIAVRWGDMDAFGHVNNTMYFRYCESTRLAYLEAIGVNLDRKGSSTGPGLVAANVNFRRQVRYPATLIATANVTALSQRSITFEHVLRDAETGQVVADGGAVCVWMDYEKERALRIPNELFRAIARTEGKPNLLTGEGASIGAKRNDKRGHSRRERETVRR